MKKSFILFLAVISVLINGCQSSDSNKSLPILGAREPVTREAKGIAVTDTVYQQIPAFECFNQASVAISNENVAKRNYVADVLFTSWASICPMRHRNRLKGYQKHKGNREVK